MLISDAPGPWEPPPGVVLRAPHVEELLARRLDVVWLEVHPDNYMADHRAFTRLKRVREHYPLSFHGVALSLGSDGELEGQHLSRLTGPFHLMGGCFPNSTAARSVRKGEQYPPSNSAARRRKIQEIA